MISITVISFWGLPLKFAFKFGLFVIFVYLLDIIVLQIFKVMYNINFFHEPKQITLTNRIYSVHAKDHLLVLLSKSIYKQ